MPRPSVPVVGVGDRISANRWNSINDAFAYQDDTGPLFYGVQQVAQTMPTSAVTAVAFGTGAEIIDRAGQHSTVTNPTRINLGTDPGTYFISASIAFQGNSTGIRNAGIYLNGASTPVTGLQAAIPAAATTVTVTVTGLVIVAANDYVELEGLQNSGSSLTTVASGGYGSAILAYRIGN
jgi:hypothetical protein